MKGNIILLILATIVWIFNFALVDIQVYISGVSANLSSITITGTFADLFIITLFLSSLVIGCEISEIKNEKENKKEGEKNMVNHRHKINEVDALRVELDILHNEQIALALRVKAIEKWIKK